MMTLAAWIGRLPEQPKTILKTSIYGLVAGAVAVAFHVTIHALFTEGLVRFSHLDRGTFVWASLLLMLGTSTVSGWLLTSFCSDAAGSGIPQLKAAFWKNFGYVEFKVAWVKFLAAALQIGGGSSLGREGPSVQLAGALASSTGGLLGEPKQRRRLGVATGAAAGLAAAFNTPLAGVTFVLEELIGDLNSRLLGSVLLGAMLGALVAHGIIGPQPAFSLAAIGEPSWRSYLLVPLVAAAGALVGVAFQKASLGLRGRQRAYRRIPGWFRPALGGLVCWGLGVLVFLQTGKLGVFELGYEDLSEALTGRLVWQIALVLLAAKFVATVACYGMGGAGGIFSPTLFFGAMTGLAIAGFARPYLGLLPEGVIMLTIVCMSATLGAVVRAPVTSILIVFEMTHQFSLVPPLMLGALISQAISRRLTRHNFYDALLEQDGHLLERFSPPRDLREWQAQPVKHLANPKPVMLASLDATHVVAVTVCRPDLSLHEIQSRLIESEAGLVLLQSTADGPIEGILTLHDILRAEQAASERGRM